MLLEKLFDNLALNVDPFATCRLADGWRLRLPCRDWVTLHYTLIGNGELKLGSGEVLQIPGNSLALMPPNLVHAVQCGTVAHETGVDGQGDPNAPLCELVAGSLEHVALTIACGRIQVNYAGGMGLFDHLKEAIVLDFSDNSKMRNIFETLIDEYRQSGPACAAMMTALMNQCLIEVLREAEAQSGGALPWLSALDDPRLSKVIETILDRPEDNYTVEGMADIAAMSRATFARHFEKCFARTPMDYLRDIRLRRAAQLLQVSSLPVDGVAGKVGYASRSQFSRAFHGQYGVSPAEFRKQYH
ncbi:MAG: helix-turn-helix transcriptional regulator [Woeseiaceae bacterium]|nr:helix-turn-helix transcriptional regulator [Woeseiaceae bacterium]